MPKVSKPKSPSRPNPLKATSGNARKKPTTSPKGKASTSSPKSQPKPKPTKLAANSKSKTSTKKSPASKNTQPNYLLFTRLRNTDDPTITRLLSVPPTLTFAGLHLVLQVAFGWANCHSHGFQVNWIPPTDNLDEEDLEEESIPPPPSAVMRLDNLDDNIRGPEIPHKKTDAVTLGAIFSDEKYADKVEIEYEYDFGDGWEHDIVFMGHESAALRGSMRLPDDFPIACLGGEGHPCAEDCGSYPGWEHLKELFVKPRSKDPDDLRDWYKNSCFNGDKKGLDPYKWDIFHVNDGLFELAKQLKLS